MERIEFNSLTNRLRRNLMFAAFLIIGIAGFDIKIGRITTSGLELKNLTTEVAQFLLVAILIYHAFAFVIRAFEEYELWKLKLAERKVRGRDSSDSAMDLVRQLRALYETLKAPLVNGQPERSGNEVTTPVDVARLGYVMDFAETYAKRFDNFPKVTRLRFWVWDIGAAGLVTAIAVLFSFSVLPAGLLKSWFL